MGLSEWGSIASIASFFQSFFRRISSIFTSCERNVNIGKDNIGGTYVGNVGGDAKIESVQHPSTSIGKNNVGGNKLDNVEGNLDLSESNHETPGSVIVGKGNVGGDYIGSVGRDLAIGTTKNDITKQFNAGVIHFNEITVSGVSQSSSQLDDLEKLGQAFNTLSFKILKYAPELPDIKDRKKALREEFIAFDDTYKSLSYNIPTPICDAVENFVFYSHLLEGLVDKLNALAPFTKNPLTSSDLQKTDMYFKENEVFFNNSSALSQRSRAIQAAIKKARGIDE